MERSACYQIASITSMDEHLMALHFFTDNPKQLLSEFNKRIDQDEPKGKITTWIRDSDGDYTHVAKDWGGKAWFRPKIIDGALVFTILGRKKVTMPVVVYGYYHGHLTETFLNHFDTLFRTASSSAQTAFGDSVGGSEA
ncbi:hypothetical protein [Pseudomonas asplenii]|uniref:hypothetical protein n=1 Tax=Pseudomonas asplenii TaxID=53407 RepID=UPI002234AE0F|nr:hypothetical protein [Pseudomonas asplenii]UZE27758.1 hypothetical protein LOY63_20700 [Pseudomonas asplenii]